MPSLPPGYIDLDRRFIPLNGESNREDLALESYTSVPEWFLQKKSLGWDDLFKHRLVVILGEAGSGKTFEFRSQAAMGSKEKFRFFVRLDELASSVDIPLTGESADLFSRWKASDGHALFFLDSVDEAKVHKREDFYRALDRFADALGPHGRNRSTMIISSRVTEWWPTVDAYEVRTRVPILIEGQQPNRLPFVVAILPLDKQRVRKYVEHRAVTGTNTFLAAIEAAHAWDFVRRPADVDDLFDFWRERGGLGTLTEILTFTTDRQLQKTSDREQRELLSLDRARLGAEFLAAATVLCGKFTFRVPGEPSSDESSLDALACLPTDWRPEEFRALMSHAIFDAATYGQIRFHHRRLSEFLGGRWLSRLMLKGCPIAELEALICHKHGVNRTIRPSLAPFAVWTCSAGAPWNRRVLGWILEASPEIILRYGDPTQLSVDDRRKVLSALATRARGQQRLWWEHDMAALTRFADAALADDILSILESPDTGHNLREFVLNLITAGQIVACRGAVLKLAISDLNVGEYYPAVMRTLREVASDSDLKTLADASEAVAVFPESVCVSLCELLFPRTWTVDALFEALVRAHPSSRGQFAWDYTLSGHLETTAKNGMGLALLKKFLHPSLDDEEEEDDPFEDFQKPWPLRLAMGVTIGMLELTQLEESEEAAIVQTLVRVGRNVSDVRSRNDRDFDGLSKGHPNIRRRFFDTAAAKMAKSHGVSRSSLSLISEFYDALTSGRDDLAWMADAIRSSKESEDRERYLRWALEIYDAYGRIKADLVAIRYASKDSSELRHAVRKHLYPGIVFHVRRFWNRRIKYRSYYWRRAPRYVRTRWEKVWSDVRLLWHRKELASGKFDNWLSCLILETHKGTGNCWVPTDWGLLQERRGKGCARAVRAGCKAVWRNYEPPLPPYKKTDGASRKTIVGLAGIMAAWQDGELDFKTLSVDDARRATHYALSELNGFTAWFPELTRGQPDIVGSVLIECVRAELDMSAVSDVSNLVLSDLAWTGDFACHLIHEFIYEELTKREPSNVQVLRYALSVLVAIPYPARERLATLAKTRSESIPVCAPTFALWLALWLQADALSALDVLESRLAVATDPITATVRICSLLGGDSGQRSPMLANPSWLTAAALRRLIPLVYQYVRREDDLDRANSIGYTPTARDDAQHFRNGLLERLSAIREPEVEGAFRELYSRPAFAHVTDYIRHLLDKRAQEFAEAQPWSGIDVRTFFAEYERDPKSDTDLFHLVVRRLMDLKEWVETGENSPREEVNRGGKESAFRRWTERRLNDTARNRYVVPQESELDGRVRPDLRVLSGGIPPVSLELKIADNWTVPELVEGLEKQLVGTYLRDSKAGYGVYLLALFERGHNWKREDGSRINSGEVLQILKSRAEAILNDQLDIAGLEVILIHFSPP